MKFKLKKPLPFAPKGTKVKLTYIPTGLFELIIYAQDGEHYYEIDVNELPEWLKFIKARK